MATPASLELEPAGQSRALSFGSVERRASTRMTRRPSQMPQPPKPFSALGQAAPVFDDEEADEPAKPLERSVHSSRAPSLMEPAEPAHNSLS